MQYRKPCSDQWKQRGSLALWRHTENERNFPGWHLTADASGSDSLVELLDAFVADGRSASRILRITKPTPRLLSVPNNRHGGANWEAPAKLRLSFTATSEEHWSFPSDIKPAQLTIGADWIKPLKEGVEGLILGRGDYAIGSSDDLSLPLWFWWQPSHE